MSGEALRTVMREFPAGVSVITVDVDGERLGLTLGTLVSLSLDPPLVGFAIAKDAAIHEHLRRAGRFGISLLAAGQDGLAQHFARGVPPIALWTGIASRDARSGAPLLDAAVGWLECELWAEYDAGDHTIFVGEVLSIALGAERPALVYVGGEYRPV